MNYTDNVYQLVEIQQVEDKVYFKIELIADINTRKVYLHNYFEGLYIVISNEKYHVYARIQDKYIIGEIVSDTIIHTAVAEGKGNVQRFYVRNRIGNTYIEQDVNIVIGEVEFSFGGRDSYTFIPINLNEFYYCKNKFSLENSFNLENSFKQEVTDVTDVTNVSIKVIGDFVFIDGNFSDQLLKKMEEETNNNKFCLAWKDMTNKKMYFFHSESVYDKKFQYCLSVKEMEPFGRLKTDGKFFEWMIVDSTGQAYGIHLKREKEIFSIQLPVKNYYAELSKFTDDSIRMKMITSIFFVYSGISENGNEIILDLKKMSAKLQLSAVIAQKVNTDIEYSLPFSIIEEDSEKIRFSIKLEFDVSENEFKIGIHQIWVEIKEGIYVSRYSLKLFRKQQIKENAYLIAPHPYAVIGEHCYNCLFYNDTSNNLKCNIQPKKLKSEITDIKISKTDIEISLKYKREPFFDGVVNSYIVTENEFKIKTKFRENSLENSNLVKIEIPIRLLNEIDVPDSIFIPEIAFNDRQERIKIENNLLRPAITNRETQQFSKIIKNKNKYHRIWGNHNRGSYVLGSTENLQLIKETAVWLEDDAFCIQLDWLNEDISSQLGKQKVALVLKNRLTEKNVVYTPSENTDNFLYRVPLELLEISDILPYVQLTNGMLSYIEMTSHPVVFPLSRRKMKIQLKKNNGILLISINELLLYEDEKCVQECENIIRKAKEENHGIKRKIWLIGENYGLSARDNGVAFFEYCMNNLDNIDAEIFFVTKEQNPDKDALVPYKNHILLYDSPEHIYYDELAEFYIVSHGIRDVMPSLYHNKLGIYRKSVIYLQHGVIAMKIMGISNKSYGNSVRKFIVSSEQEKMLLVKKRQFWEDEIAITGLSRYDKLSSEGTLSSKYIWMMPTWRDWLIQSEKEFINSDFYIYYSRILSDKTLSDKLRNAGKRLVFCLHVEFEKYKNLFNKFESDVIHITDMHEENISNRLKECSMMVTDYSSIVFDAIYLGKPVVFFQYDLEMYLKYRGSYVNLETDLPGKVTRQPEELISILKENIENDFVFPPEYKKIAERYFAYHDTNNSERIYKAIIECREEIADEY